jgi:hypothetical protein
MKIIMKKKLIILLFVLSLTFTSLVSATHSFDLSVEVLPEYGEIDSGKELALTIKLIKFQMDGPEDVILKYSLLDMDGEKTIVEFSETVAVHTSLTKIKQIKIPFSLKEGQYTLEVVAKYDSYESKSSHGIYVKNVKDFEKILIGIIVLSLLFLILFLGHSNYKLTKKLIENS